MAHVGVAHDTGEGHCPAPLGKILPPAESGNGGLVDESGMRRRESTRGIPRQRQRKARDLSHESRGDLYLQSARQPNSSCEVNEPRVVHTSGGTELRGLTAHSTPLSDLSLDQIASCRQIEQLRRICTGTWTRARWRSISMRILQVKSPLSGRDTHFVGCQFPAHRVFESMAA